MVTYFNAYVRYVRALYVGVGAQRRRSWRLRWLLRRYDDINNNTDAHENDEDDNYDNDLDDADAVAHEVSKPTSTTTTRPWLLRRQRNRWRWYDDEVDVTDRWKQK